MRINRAGDDAAGLAISEKMRGQIRGLKQAQRNAQDGISLIQTAEGALNETHAILQRMRELATQASTDTNTLTDRKEIQKEINQLLDEIDRIADKTTFNTQKLLDGSYDKKIFHIGANEGDNMEISITSMKTDALGGGSGVAGTPATVVAGVADESAIDSVEIKADSSYDGEYTLTVTTDSEGDTTAELSGPGSFETIKDVEVTGETFTIGDFTVSLKDFDGLEEGVLTISLTATPYKAPSIADLKVEDVDAVTEDTVDAGGVLTQAGADAAITNINDAIEQVSAERSKLGAIQNRLEHTIANLGTSAENLQAAESRIRDLDMAEEIMAFTKNNILQQAATAMLAQANMAPQSVLQLLG
jgi:flagellin